MFYKETNFKQEPLIGNVPKEWEVVRLKDVADYINGYPFSPKDWKDKGLPIIRIQNLNDPNAEFNYFEGDIEDKYIVENGDLLFSWSASIGAYIWNRGKAVLNQHIFKVVPNDNIDKLYLFYALFLAIEQLKQKVHGSTMKHFKKTELQTKIPLPPLPEQKEIAKVLGVVDSVIAKTGEVIAKTERLKKGLMQTLLTRGIGHKEYKQTPIGTTPKTWEIVRLGEVLELCQYGLSARFGDRGKYHILKMDDIVDGVAIPDNAKYIDLDERTFENFKLEKGDILFNRTNSYELVGRTGIFLLDGDYTFASYLIRLRPKKEIVDSLFLTYYMIFSNNRLRQLATRAVHQANINATNLQSFTIPIPPLSEQKKIAETLMTLDKKLEFERKEKAKLERIKQGLMDLLLTGKVRVKVD